MIKTMTLALIGALAGLALTTPANAALLAINLDKVSATTKVRTGTIRPLSVIDLQKIS